MVWLQLWRPWPAAVLFNTNGMIMVVNVAIMCALPSSPQSSQGTISVYLSTSSTQREAEAAAKPSEACLVLVRRCFYSWHLEVKAYCTRYSDFVVWTLGVGWAGVTVTPEATDYSEGCCEATDLRGCEATDYNECEATNQCHLICSHCRANPLLLWLSIVATAVNDGAE